VVEAVGDVPEEGTGAGVEGEAVVVLAGGAWEVGTDVVGLLGVAGEDGVEDGGGGGGADELGGDEAGGEDPGSEVPVEELPVGLLPLVG
jgi:hypothetical protein